MLFSIFNFLRRTVEARYFLQSLRRHFNEICTSKKSGNEHCSL